MKYKHIIWDWNGTLVDDSSLCVDILNELLDEYGKKNISLKFYRANFSFPVVNFYRKISLPYSGNEFEEISKKFISRQEEHVKSLNIEQAILSAGNQYDVEKFVKYYGLNSYFERILGTDNIKAEGKVELAMRFFLNSDYRAEEILIIGDTLHDLDIGNKIGCETILSSMGHNSESLLTEFHDFLVNDLREISKYLQH